jgi:hypothetical protein
MRQIVMHHKVVTGYGCVRCQRWHIKDQDPLYAAHLYHQSKHGVREWVDPTQWEPETRIGHK